MFYFFGNTELKVYKQMDATLSISDDTREQRTNHFHFPSEG
jgi:hypothetical protein